MLHILHHKNEAPLNINKVSAMPRIQYSCRHYAIIQHAILRGPGSLVHTPLITLALNPLNSELPSLPLLSHPLCPAYPLNFCLPLFFSALPPSYRIPPTPGWALFFLLGSRGYTSCHIWCVRFAACRPVAREHDDVLLVLYTAVVGSGTTHRRTQTVPYGLTFMRNSVERTVCLTF